MDRSTRGASAAQSIGPSDDCGACGAPFARSVPEQVLCDGCQGLIVPDPDFPAQEAEAVAGYRLVRKLGAGRFSTSWLAESPQGVGVVLKVLRAEAASRLSLPRFLEEAQRLARKDALDHEGVARLLDAGAPGGGEPYLVYEAGGEFTLADELRAQGQVALPRALVLCAQLAEALDAVHAAGVLHLDLKPANVGLAVGEDGAERAVLLDAVTAHLAGQDLPADGANLPLSTAAYVSPEQARGGAAETHADFYALGVLLYQLVTGGLPVYGSTSGELLQAHRDQRPLRLRDAGSHVRPELEEAMARMLAKDPALRFQSGAALSAALRAFAAEPEPQPHELGSSPPVLPDEPAWSASAFAPGQALTYGPRAPPDVEEALARAMLDGTLPREPRPRWRPAFRLRARSLPRWATPVRLTPIAFALVLAASATLAVRAARTKPPATPQAAQQLLDDGNPAEAKGVLHEVLARPGLAAHERAEATFLLATAYEAAGEKQAAIAWYRKYLRLGRDPRERARAARRIHALSR